MKKLFLAGAVFLLLLLASCGEVTDSQTAYNFGLTNFTGSFTAQTQVEDYLKNELRLPWGIKFYTGNDSADTDKQAISDFDAAAAKIRKTRLDSIAGTGSFSFTYAVYTSGSEKNPLDSYTYIYMSW
jgi:hypothetical protein